MALFGRSKHISNKCIKNVGTIIMMKNKMTKNKSIVNEFIEGVWILNVM